MDEIISKSASVQELISALQTLLENGSRHHAGQRSYSFAGKSILLADDDTYSRLVAKTYLERCDANVIEAEHGQAVLARLQENGAIDAVLMDMNMPGLSGVQATTQIRARTDRHARVPIIALTSQSDIESVHACLAAGMNEVMIKPVQAGSLYACLARQFAPRPALNVAPQSDRSSLPVASTSQPQTIAQDDLLDEDHLEELVALDLLDDSFINGIEQIRALVERLAASAVALDIESAHGALHVLLGVSGNIGARALHQFARQMYPRVIDGEWPAEPDWLARICTLGERSADALQTYYASTKARRAHRDAVNE
jgi:CheY-like chemotaxis protein